VDVETSNKDAKAAVIVRPVKGQYSPTSLNWSPMSPPLATGITWGSDKQVQVQPFAEPSCLI
jgi:hypothetical protein